MRHDKRKALNVNKLCGESLRCKVEWCVGYGVIVAECVAIVADVARLFADDASCGGVGEGHALSRLARRLRIY